MWTTAMGRLGRSSGGAGERGGTLGVGKNGGAVENFVGLV